MWSMSVSTMNLSNPCRSTVSPRKHKCVSVPEVERGHTITAKALHNKQHARTHARTEAVEDASHLDGDVASS